MWLAIQAWTDVGLDGIVAYTQWVYILTEVSHYPAYTNTLYLATTVAKDPEDCRHSHIHAWSTVSTNNDIYEHNV